MSENNSGAAAFHGHVFLGEQHEHSERRTWAVIWLCGAMMVGEIVGGLLFSQLLTLYTTPVIYLALDRLNRRIEKTVPEPGPPSELAVLFAQAVVGYVQYFSGVPEVLVAVHIVGAVTVWVATLQFMLQLSG